MLDFRSDVSVSKLSGPLSMQLVHGMTSKVHGQKEHVQRQCMLHTTRRDSLCAAGPPCHTS